MASSNDGGSWKSIHRAFRISRAFAITIALAVSLAANATLFVGGVLYNVVDDFLASATGLQTASTKQRKVIRGLQKENRQLRGQIKKVRGVARNAAKRTRNRLVNSAKRSVATLAGKAVPFAGVAVSAGVTAMEIKDLCDTVRDMNGIVRQIDPSDAEADGEPTVCSMSVPSVGEIWARIKDSPKEVWEEARNFVPDLKPLNEMRELTSVFWKDTLKDIRSIIGSFE